MGDRCACTRSTREGPTRVGCGARPLLDARSAEGLRTPEPLRALRGGRERVEAGAPRRS